MPHKTQEITNASISLIYAVGGLFSLFSIIGVIVSSYAFFVIKTINEKIIALRTDGNKAAARLEKDIAHHREMHEDHYNKIHDLEKMQMVMKTEHDINHNRGKK